VRPAAAINILSRHELEACKRCDARHQGLCDALHDDDLHFLSDAAHRSAIAKGEVFVTEGNPARNFFNINQGTAKLYMDLADGRRQITGFVGVGDFVGLAAGTRYAFSAEAIEPVQLCRFDRIELRAVSARFPVIERRLLEIASHELVIAQEQMLLLGRKTAIERVASFLEGWYRRTLCADPGAPLDLPMLRGDLAEYLGLTIETVSRVLASLRRQGVVAVAADHRISILDHARLAAIGQTFA
jgi:CRP/FNR family transcriptional regulator